MANPVPESVWVQVVELDADRQIAFSSAAEHLRERTGDIKAAIVAGSSAVAESVDSLESPRGWELDEVSASFGVALTAEAGVILTKVSGQTTFEVSVTFRRNGGGGGGK
jgi:Trypsin-co-occurring domain 1